MKSLVLYYSLEGNTKKVAEAIASEIGAELGSINRKKDFKHRGFGKYFFGGFEAIFKAKPELLPLDVNLSEYDLIFMGTPVWAGQYNPVFRSLMEKENFDCKKVVLFATFGGDAGKSLLSLKEGLDKAIIIGTNGFKTSPKEVLDANVELAKVWAQEILKKI